MSAGLAVSVDHHASETFASVRESELERLRPWTFDQPLVLSAERDAELARLQRAVRTLLVHHVEHGTRADRPMELAPRAQWIVDLYESRPYQPGSHRTDFVVTGDGAIRLIEITCRYALNGFLVSGGTDLMAERFAAERGLSRLAPYRWFWPHLLERLQGRDRVCILAGDNARRNDGRLLARALAGEGIDVRTIPAAAVDGSHRLLRGAAIVSELSHDELFALSDETLRLLVDGGVLNDLRTVLIAHDKRWFSLLRDPALLADALAPADRPLVLDHTLPTYAFDRDPAMWTEARAERHAWILKPANLGMSQGVLAGPLTEQADWEQAIDERAERRLVLQSYSPQRLFAGTVGGTPHRDYVVGTLLWFDDRHFGVGICRSSSHPVTNVTDDRKLFPLVLADPTSCPDGIVL